MKRDYEVLFPLKRNGELTERGGVISLEEEDAAPLLRNRTLRNLPERASKPKGRPRKQESEAEDSNEE